MPSTRGKMHIAPFVLSVSGVSMQTLLVSFTEQDATLDRLTSLANHLGITPEDLAKRAFVQYLGDYQLKDLPVDFKPTGLKDLFAHRGLMYKK